MLYVRVGDHSKVFLTETAHGLEDTSSFGEVVNIIRCGFRLV